MFIRNTVWVFGSGNGTNFADNSREFFKYCSTRNNIKCVWLTKSSLIRDEVRSLGLECHHYYSLRGMYYALTAKVVVICNSFADVNVFSYALFPRSKIIAQLWHGTPLKVLENMKFRPTKGILLKIFLLYIGKDCDFVVSATSKNTPVYVKKFNVQPRQVLISGQPRNDALLTASVRKPKTAKKVIWYMPTFREYDPAFDFFDQYGFNLIRLDKLLGKYNAHLVIKLHHVEASRNEALGKRVAEAKNISITQGGNTYEGLAQSYALLTDYSSVYFDYLLLNKPIIFTNFDYDEYKVRRDFYYDYNAVTPGPKAANWAEVEHYLTELFNGTDGWSRQRKAVNKQFNEFNDNQSARRVYAHIMKVLK